MILLAEASELVTSPQFLGSLIGGAIGGAVAALPAVRRKWKTEARAEARKVTSVMLADHQAGCAWRPALTPSPTRR